MNLFDSLKKYDVPVTPAAPEFICTIKSTRAGKQIMLCSVDPAPQTAIDQATKSGFPLFVASEIAQMVDLDQKTVELVLSAKTEFPGCRVEAIIRDGSSA